jgi:hypothetical protein
MGFDGYFFTLNFTLVFTLNFTQNGRHEKIPARLINHAGILFVILLGNGISITR